MSKAVYTAPLLAGIPTPSTAYVGSALATGTTTSAAQLRWVVRAALVQLPEPMLCSDIWTYASGTVAAVGAGTDACAIRIYPANADGSPVLNSLPLHVITGPTLTTNGDKLFTPGSNIMLPQMFYATLIHDYATTAPTMVSWQTTGTVRGMPQSALATNPATSPVSNMAYTWTEASYSSGAARAWGNAAVTLTSQAVWFLYKKV